MKAEMTKENDFITPPDHVNFLAKKLFEGVGEIENGSIAYLQPGGGGPVAPHVHGHDHLFIVTKGEAKVLLDDDIKIIHENEAIVVNGFVPHSVWNNIDGETVMIGITLKKS